MNRPVALAVVALLMLGLVPSPALAENKAYLVTHGIAEISKTPFFDETTCEDLWMPVTGGLGWPIISGVKKGYWRMQVLPLNVTSPLDPVYMFACGKLNPVARALTGAATSDPDDGGIGAACGMSKGYDGRGRLHDYGKDDVIELTNIAWKATALGSILLTGHAEWPAKETSKGRGRLIARLGAGGSGCEQKAPTGRAFEKNPEKYPYGARYFTITGEVTVIQEPVAGLVPKWKDLPGSEEGAQDNPAFCKGEDLARCPVYGPKKQHDHP